MEGAVAQNSSDHKRPRICIQLPEDQVVQLFPFEVVVAIKSRFGPVEEGELVERMMQEIVILSENEVEIHGKPDFSTATGVATFPVSIRKAGNLQISAAVRYKGELCTRGVRGVVIRVGPGAMKLKLLVEEEAVLGEQVELVVVPDSTDVFGNKCQWPLGKSLLSSFGADSLSESLRQARFEVPGTTGDVLKDEFGTALSGRHLIGKVDEKYETLRDCLLHDIKFADREEKIPCYGRIKEYVKSLNEKHTLFGLGKGRFKSSVAKCISETDDLALDPEKGGTAEIFRGEYQGSSVAVKIPLFMKSEGL